MTCTMPGAFDDQIDDYVDRTLDEPARAALDAHLAACAACRALVTDFQAIRTAAAALEPHVPPPHVWTTLAARVAPAARQSRFHGWVAAWQPIAATLVLASCVGSLWWVGDRLSLAAAGGAARVHGGLAAGNGSRAASGGDAFSAAENHFTTAIGDLEQIARAEQAALDPDTAGVLQANLTILDEAIVDSRTALASEPDSEIAQESLFEALRSKVALLQDTLALINEMRKGDEEAAARIVSGLNQ
jgi:anti-sigma factor RsiW